MPSRVRNSACFTGSCSTIASTTSWQSFTSAMVVVKVIAPTSADCSSSLSLPRLTARFWSRRWTLAPALEGLLGQLDADHLVAVAGEHLGDAGTHGAEADHADGGEVASSASSWAESWHGRRRSCRDEVHPPVTPWAWSGPSRWSR